MPEDRDIGVRPERLLQDLGETEFIRRHQCGIRTLAAFEKSEYADDRRDLMRLFLIRRTRSFIQDNYADTDPDTKRRYLTFEDGSRSYFPRRIPLKVPFALDDADPSDQYARLYAEPVVDAINRLTLPRYGLGNYTASAPAVPPTPAESRGIQNLSRAGKRLMGFCRTNLFKKSGILDGDADGEVDLASYVYQIWKNAVTADPRLLQTIPAMPPVVFSTKAHRPTMAEPEGVLVYLHTAEGNDALAWMGRDGRGVTESQFAILKAAACPPDAPALPRAEDHHHLVELATARISAEEKTVGGQLGRPSGARFRVYERLMAHAESLRATLFRSIALERAVEDIYRFPLRQTAVDTLNRQLRAGIADDDLAQLVIALRDEDRLCNTEEERQSREATIICSLGLAAPRGGK